MIPIAIVVAAITRTVPTLPPQTADRYAIDIANASEDLETAMALVATAAVESGFRETIERCHCKRWECDGGKAFGIYQLHAHWLGGHSRFEVCRDNELSTVLAASAIVRLRGRVGRMDRVFTRFVGARTAGVEERIAIYEDLMGVFGEL